MICNNCGNQVADNANVCPYCGTPFAASAPQAAQPQYAQPAQTQYAQPVQNQYAQPQYAQPQYGQVAQAPVGDANEREMSKSTLIWGILGIAFGCSFYLSFLGIIFGAIGLGKAKNYMAAGYPLAGRAKTGRILALVGMILGIVLTVFFVIWLIAVIAAASYTSSYYYYY